MLEFTGGHEFARNVVALYQLENQEVRVILEESRCQGMAFFRGICRELGNNFQLVHNAAKRPFQLASELLGAGSVGVKHQ